MTYEMSLRSTVLLGRRIMCLCKIKVREKDITSGTHN